MPQLTVLLGDPEPDVRLPAIAALAAYGAGARSALPALRGCVQDPAAATTGAAKAAIERIENARA